MRRDTMHDSNIRVIIVTYGLSFLQSFDGKPQLLCLLERCLSLIEIVN